MNRVVGAIVLSPTDASGREAVVGSAQRVVVARARDPRHAAVKHCLEYLGSYHPDFDLEGSTRSGPRTVRECTSGSCTMHCVCPGRPR